MLDDNQETGKKKKNIDDRDTKKNINLGENKCSSRHLMYNYQSDG
jgi:hypothetical protein